MQSVTAQRVGIQLAASAAQKHIKKAKISRAKRSAAMLGWAGAPASGHRAAISVPLGGQFWVFLINGCFVPSIASELEDRMALTQ